MRPLEHELTYCYIAGDGKKFLDEDKARNYQRHLVTQERKQRFEERKKESSLLSMRTVSSSG
jgi:hypothetical protein